MPLRGKSDNDHRLDKLLFERHPDPIVLVDQHGSCLKINQSFCSHFHIKEEQVIGAKIADLLKWENWDDLWLDFQSANVSRDVFLHDRAGKPLTAMVTSVLIDTMEDQKVIYLLINRISEQKLLGDQFQEKFEILNWIETNSSDFITILDENGIVTYASPSYTKIFGRPHEDILYRHAFEFVHPEDVPFLQERLTESFSGYIYWHPVEFRYLHGDGHWVYADVRATQINSANGARKIILFARDISLRKRQEEQIQHMAYHDALTGLPNRTFLFERMSQLLKRKSAANEFGILFVDLDGFKAVNDTLGHAAGDYLLQLVAKRLQSVISNNGFLARMGGDEFVILIDNLNYDEDAKRFAQEILSLVEKPYRIQHVTVNVTSSIGISLYPQHGKTIDELIHAADSSLYKAKGLGRNTFVVAAMVIDKNNFG